MRRVLLALVFASVALVFGSKAHAARTAPTMVAIRCSCDDRMGKAYLEAVKSLLRQQAEYQEVGFEHSRDKGVLVIEVTSKPVAGDDDRSGTVLSIVCTHEGAVMNESIETSCDKVPLADCAKSMVDGLHDVL